MSCFKALPTILQYDYDQFITIILRAMGSSRFVIKHFFVWREVFQYSAYSLFYILVGLSIFQDFIALYWVIFTAVLINFEVVAD